MVPRRPRPNSLRVRVRWPVAFVRPGGEPLGSPPTATAGPLPTLMRVSISTKIRVTPTNARRRAGVAKRNTAIPSPREKHDEAIREDCIRYVGLPTGEFIAHRTLEHLKTSKAKKEFIFLFLVDAHDHKLTYFAPPRLEEMFLGHPAPKKRPKVVWEKDNDYSDEHRRIVRALYDAGIRYSDEALGQLIEGLGEEQLKNTFELPHHR